MFHDATFRIQNTILARISSSIFERAEYDAATRRRAVALLTRFPDDLRLPPLANSGLYDPDTAPFKELPELNAAPFFSENVDRMGGPGPGNAGCPSRGRAASDAETPRSQTA